MSQLPIIIINLKHIESRLYFMYHVQILTHLCLYACYFGWVDVCFTSILQSFCGHRTSDFKSEPPTPKNHLKSIISMIILKSF